MGMKVNFVVSIVALVIAIVGCALAVRLSFFQLAPISKEQVTAMVEEKIKPYVSEEKIKEIVEGVIATLKPAAPEGGEE